MLNMDQKLPEITQISDELGCSEAEINDVLLSLPTGDVEEVTFLDGAGQWILEVSSLINDKFPNLTPDDRTAKKFKLMGKMLELKAEEMVS